MSDIELVTSVSAIFNLPKKSKQALLPMFKELGGLHQPLLRV
jgi:hypothetical protein